MAASPGPKLEGHLTLRRAQLLPSQSPLPPPRGSATAPACLPTCSRAARLVEGPPAASTRHGHGPPGEASYVWNQSSPLLLKHHLIIQRIVSPRKACLESFHCAGRCELQCFLIVHFHASTGTYSPEKVFQDNQDRPSISRPWPAGRGHASRARVDVPAIGAAQVAGRGWSKKKKCARAWTMDAALIAGTCKMPGPQEAMSRLAGLRLVEERVTADAPCEDQARRVPQRAVSHSGRAEV